MSFVLHIDLLNVSQLFSTHSDLCQVWDVANVFI